MSIPKGICSHLKPKLTKTKNPTISTKYHSKQFHCQNSTNSLRNKTSGVTAVETGGDKIQSTKPQMFEIPELRSEKNILCPRNRATEVAQWVQAPTTKPATGGRSLGPQLVEGEN